MQYESTQSLESKVMPGVAFTIARMSFGRRVDLMRNIRELARSAEYGAAGQKDSEKIESLILAESIERLYVEWGLRGIEGLEIDGVAATPGTLLDHGPLALTREIAEAIRAECGLSEEQRKN